MNSAMDNLLKKRKELKHRVEVIAHKFYEDLYYTLIELLAVERRINPKYTIRQLALDNLLGEQFVYQLLTWRKASDSVKKAVREGKITMKKATRMMRKSGRCNQDDAIMAVLKYKMSDDEIDRHIKKYGVEKQQLIDEREYSSRWDIARDALHYCSKFNRSLLAIKNIPKSERAKVLKALKIHHRLVCTAIKVLNGG